jgi:hypothetical protein
MSESLPNPTRISPVLDEVKRIGGYRDVILVLASLVYLLGYLSWAFYAAQNDLGLVPALDTQYLIAGVLPTIILAVGVALALLQLRFSKWSSTNPSPTRYRWGARLSVAAAGLVGGGFFIGYFLNGTAESIAAGVAVVGVYALMAGSLLQGSRGDKLLRVFGLIALWVVVVLIPLVMLLAYFEKVFPYVPAAVGGPSPRCVVVDLATQELSSNTLASLLPQDSVTSSLLSTSAGVRHTRPLELLFASSEFAMLRVKDQGPRGSVYSIAKHAIQALAPCPADTATKPLQQ